LKSSVASGRRSRELVEGAPALSLAVLLSMMRDSNAPVACAFPDRAHRAKVHWFTQRTAKHAVYSLVP